MQNAAIVLGLAAVGGLTLAVIRLRGAPRPPTWLALGHGAIAVVGVALLILAAVDPGLPQLGKIALGVILAAAAGGSAMFLGFHLRGRPLPIPLVIGHGLLAATGYALLLAALRGVG